MQHIAAAALELAEQHMQVATWHGTNVHLIAELITVCNAETFQVVVV
jgi:hypothetical protein